MKNTLKIASKCFLFGEYAVLAQGPAIIACTAPFFELHWESATEKSSNPFHPESIAGRFWLQEQIFFSKYNVQFFDPHQAKGGFGGSTAEFLTLYCMQKKIQQAEINIWQCWKEYLAIAKTANYNPSGADLIAQLQHYLWQVDTNITPSIHTSEQTKSNPKTQQSALIAIDFSKQNCTKLIQKSHTEILLIHTGQKVKTHKHLQELELQNIHTELNQMTLSALECFQHSPQEKAQTLGQLMTQWNHFLHKQKLVLDNSHAYCQKIEALNSVYGVKACGALGADLIAVFLVKENRNKIAQLLEQINASENRSNTKAKLEIVALL